MSLPPTAEKSLCFSCKMRLGFISTVNLHVTLANPGEIVVFFNEKCALYQPPQIPCVFSGKLRLAFTVTVNSYDSRSKVLYSNFSLRGPQPTHLYDFSISLCGVTQGNHAKHKLGARFAQGWRKCFHACVDNPNIFYISHILSCMYIDFIIKVFL